MVKDLFNESNRVIKEIINRPSNTFIKNNSSDFAQELEYHNNDLEKYLSFLYSQQKEDRIFASFLSYLEDIFFLASDGVTTGLNNYKTLINRMWDFHGKKHWGCISFNYDTILEQSYLIAGRDISERDFSDLESYLNYNPVILKMHGGINFRYIFKKPLADDDSKIYNNHVLFSKMMSESGKVDDFIQTLRIGDGKPNLH